MCCNFSMAAESLAIGFPVRCRCFSDGNALDFVVVPMDGSVEAGGEGNAVNLLLLALRTSRSVRAYRSGGKAAILFPAQRGTKLLLGCTVANRSCFRAHLIHPTALGSGVSTTSAEACVAYCLQLRDAATAPCVRARGRPCTRSLLPCART
jgi:hypothetical protein